MKAQYAWGPGDSFTFMQNERRCYGVVIDDTGRSVVILGDGARVRRFDVLLGVPHDAVPTDEHTGVYEVNVALTAIRAVVSALRFDPAAVPRLAAA